jgi:hypothetical protein
VATAQDIVASIEEGFVILKMISSRRNASDAI